MHLREAPLTGATSTKHLPASQLSETFPKGRRCVEDGCITVLCMYNGGPWCYRHAQRHEAEVIEAHQDRCLNGKPREMQAA